MEFFVSYLIVGLVTLVMGACAIYPIIKEKNNKGGKR